MAWIVVAVLMPVALLNYLDRQMLASMKESVMRDIPTIVSEQNWGYMLGQFKWVYAVFSLLGGYLADRFSRRLDDLHESVRVVDRHMDDCSCDYLPRS